LPSGGPRWQPRLNKARTRLVKRGWLEATTWRGDWELTERGWAKARRDRMPRERRRAGAEVGTTDIELAVAA
jgi:hypothetical protein